MSISVPDHLGWEVLIEGVAHVRIKYIGLKPCCESGVPVCSILQSLLGSCMSVRIYDDTLLPWKVDLEVQNTGLMVLHLKEVKPPAGLAAADISGIQVLLDLICTGAKLHGGAVMALVHILVDVLDCLDRGDGLNIEMAAVLPDEIPGVADDPAIVNLKPPNCMGLASVCALGACIRVISDSGVLPEGFGKALAAAAIDHAG
jgi:hypothetical protein